MELEALQEAYDQIKAAGAELVAISPQLQEYSRQIKNKNGLEFDILIDPWNSVAEKFGLKWAFQDYLIEAYKGFSANLDRFNGDESWTLPMPARYVVKKDGSIYTADFDPDYTRRPEPQKTVNDLRELALQEAN